MDSGNGSQDSHSMNPPSILFPVIIQEPHHLIVSLELSRISRNIFSPASKGPNHLIQEGAKLVRNCSDILEELNLLNLSQVVEQLETKPPAPATDAESQILSYLSPQGTYVDDICHRSGLPISTVSALIFSILNCASSVFARVSAAIAPVPELEKMSTSFLVLK
jgi:hypothetical protein